METTTEMHDQEQTPEPTTWEEFLDIMEKNTETATLKEQRVRFAPTM